MRKYLVIHRNKSKEIQAKTAYEAQKKGAELFKVKKAWNVSVVLADVPFEPATL